MSQADDNESVVSFINDFDDDPIKIGVAGAIRLPSMVRNAVFQVTNPMPHLLQMNGLFGGQVVEDANQHLHNFVDVCIPIKMWNISQESI